MNIFVIPSIYPSADHPLSGIYIQEQVEMLANNHPEINFGVCLWGQNETANQLWANEPFKNLKKIYQSFKRKSAITPILPNLKLYYTPRFQWSESIKKGNLNSIIDACSDNLKNFEKDFGKCSLLHAHVSYPAGFIAFKLKQKFKIPYLITEHMTRLRYEEHYLNKSPYNKEAVLAFQSADSVIAVSQSLGHDLFKVVPRDVFVVPNPTNEHFFKPDSTNRPKDKFFVLSNANIIHSKGIHQLLDTIARVKRVIPNIEYRIIGTGKDFEFYKQREKVLRIENDVKWLGELPRNRVLEELHYCDVFMLTSYHETFGQVFAEAIACGKPIVCTLCGGPEDIVNGTNGVIGQYKDSVDSAKKLIHLLQNLDKYDEKAIRKDFEMRFSSKVITPKIVEIYRKTAHG